MRDLLDDQAEDRKIRFSPDVGFVLDPSEPTRIDTGALADVRKDDSTLVGLNVSGLLFNGGYTQENMFGLKSDYRQLVYSIVDFLMTDETVLIVLIPHVFMPPGHVESDPEACRKIYEELSDRYPDRVFLTRGPYNHNEIKYVIGLCDFFIGSRMHSCIAALSQFIPAVGLAYSAKFKGVFESIGLKECVADAYECKSDDVLSIVRAAFEARDRIRAHLETVIPEMQRNILDLFADETSPGAPDPMADNKQRETTTCRSTK
jgi:colanic acid/amylovoran biosynthesis protein